MSVTPPSGIRSLGVQVRISPKLQGDAWPAVQSEMIRIVKSQYEYMREQAHARSKQALELHDREINPKASRSSRRAVL